MTDDADGCLDAGMEGSGGRGRGGGRNNTLLTYLVDFFFGTSDSSIGKKTPTLVSFRFKSS